MTSSVLSSARRVVVVGANGGLGNALIETIHARNPECLVYAASRSGSSHASPAKQRIELALDVTDEASVQAAAGRVADTIDAIIVAVGVLHGTTIKPEKSLTDIDPDAFADVLRINTIGPLLIAKHFAPKLERNRPSLFAAFSARVGSIGDNRLGGWYAYRASKAALNMGIRNLAIELKRRRKQAIVVGLHPGTVATSLSAPFQRNLPAGQLREPADAAAQLIDVINGLTPADSGSCYDWQGKRIDN